MTVGKWQFRQNTYAVMLVIAAIMCILPVQSKDSHTKQAHVAKPAHSSKVSNNPVELGSRINSNGHKWMTARVLIKAPPHVVWQAVHEERQLDPDLEYSKILEKANDSHESTLEQKFVMLPIIGTAICVMKNIEVPHEKIEYSLLRSDRFKALEGAWTLTPTNEGKATILELASYIDMGMPIPRHFVDGATVKKLEKRVRNVQHHAEVNQVRLAQQSENH